MALKSSFTQVSAAGKWKTQDYIFNTQSFNSEGVLLTGYFII